MWITLEQILSLCDGFNHAEAYKLDIYSMIMRVSAENLFPPDVQRSYT